MVLTRSSLLRQARMNENASAMEIDASPIDAAAGKSTSPVQDSLVVKLDLNLNATIAPAQDLPPTNENAIASPTYARQIVSSPTQTAVTEVISLQTEENDLPLLSTTAPKPTLPTDSTFHLQSVQDVRPQAPGDQDATATQTSFAHALLQLKHGHATSAPDNESSSPSATSGVEIPTTTVESAVPEKEAEQVTAEMISSPAPDTEEDCISVHRPRPAGEDIVLPEDSPALEPADETREQPSDASLTQSLIVIMRLPQDATRTVKQTNPAAPAEHITYTPPHTIASTPSETAGASPPALSPAAMPTPPSDADIQEAMQEPDGPADPTADRSALPPSKASSVVLQVDMMKFDAGLFARDRNPRRAATRMFGEVKTPEKQPKLQFKVKPVKAFVQPSPSPLPQSQPQPQARSTRSNKRAREDDTEFPAKQFRKLTITPASSRRGTLTTQPSIEPKPFFTLDGGEARPNRDVEYDTEYVEKISEVLAVAAKAKANDVARKQARRILQLLQQGKLAGEDDALYLTASEAQEYLRPGQFFKNIIITAEQQPLPLQTIQQFLDEFYEEDAKVSIQDSSAKTGKNAPSVRQVKIRAVRERIAGKVCAKPWNLLELATHHEDGLRPIFLNNEDCRLLTKLKIPGAADDARRRTYPQGFKEVEKWALLAQAGALTEPHQDSHGYSTYITVNVGHVGFGWLCSPTEAERAQWRKQPLRYTGGNWRWVILKPGQTVYFPAGTVHFVFRLPAAGNTLAFGGHVLRCSNIAHWARTLLEERDALDVTNEDLTDSATGYLDRVGRFVEQALKSGDVEKWGGREEIQEFLRLKKEFLAHK